MTAHSFPGIALKTSPGARPTPASRRAAKAPTEPVQDVRERILDTASSLFYQRGVRAVGVDLVVAEAAVAKTSLYRYFPTKDDLIVAFLEREDVDFWGLWDAVAAQHAEDPAGELQAHMQWIGERLGRSNYRGCPQINVAAEFAEQDHPARQVAQQHMVTLRSRLYGIAQRLGVPQPEQLAAQLAVLINGAFVSSGLLSGDEATPVLQAAVQALLAGAQADRA
ncbi:TetR/AcrR family transcriptional regulator [Acidovorax sp. D2M1]|uniref:TetR/AcrR family transcriptional regulator n=1 Tax=Acidovorax benzenivorans TaxID=2987520 RepID=A0ABT5S2V4_9BURK|nr:TetR/AcrR family transcriptional regulator [Acidovorax benzenivorans]MDD2180275.1 TetR/AcrR family transcriptional regulator [Acidovorax benzenivorans]